MGINELEELAYSCRVSLNAACKQTGMATSTPYRWKHGSRPSSGQAERLENAILQVAVNRGTLPSELESRIPSGIVKQSDDAKTIARHLRHIADQVEALAK